MIPKDIYICYKNLEELKEYSSIWKKLNPEYTLHLYDDQMCIEFLEKNYSRLHAEIFKYIPEGPIKADFWRICILYRYGGLYVDADIEPIIPLRDFIDDTADFISSYCFCYNNMVNPQFLMSYSGDLILGRCINTYIKYYNEEKPYGYWDWSIVFIMKNILNDIGINEKYYKNYLFTHNNKKYQFLQVIDYDSNNRSIYVNRFYKNTTLHVNRYTIYNNSRVFNNNFRNYDYNEHYFINITYLEIPKVIHINMSNNNQLENIQSTWKQFYKNWDIKIWYNYHLIMNIETTDKNINNLIFNKFYKSHREYHLDITRTVNILKFIVLYEYGGIFINNELICNKNYENEFSNDKVTILYDPSNTSNMIISSPIKHIFWEYAFEYVFDSIILQYISFDVSNIIEIGKAHIRHCIVKNINEC